MATKARAASIINGRILSKDFFYLSLYFDPRIFFLRHCTFPRFNDNN